MGENIQYILSNITLTIEAGKHVEPGYSQIVILAVPWMAGKWQRQTFVGDATRQGALMPVAIEGSDASCRYSL